MDSATTPTQLRCVPMALTLTAPDHVDVANVAQAVADALRTLERAETAERYPTRADIVLSPEQPTAADLMRSGARLTPGHRLVMFLGLIWARRSWDDEGVESSALMVDVRQAVAALCSIRWRTEEVVGMPIDTQTILTAARTGRILRTVDPEEHLVTESSPI